MSSGAESDASAGSGAGSGAASGTSTGATGTGTGATGTSTGATGTSAGTSTGATGASTGATGTSTGATSGVTVSGSTSGSIPGPDAGSSSIRPSPGCNGSTWTGPLGQWVAQPSTCAQGVGNQGTDGCQAIPPGSTVPAMATQGSPEHRGWEVYVPKNYNPSKPYRVIYSGGGCGGGNWFQAGTSAYNYNTVDAGDAIMVGLGYDTYSHTPGCYDAADPQSNDLQFFPWLQSQIESQLCVDMNHEFFSGFASGASLGQQLDCAFPDKLRGFVVDRGCEPGDQPGVAGALPACVSKPTAALFVHDTNDAAEPLGCILPACARVLQQNGCTTTSCDPASNPPTTSYTLPPGVRGGGARCVQFAGCPADYPVVFCTSNPGHADDTTWGVVTLFWDFMNRLSPPAPSCAAGVGFENGVCAPCSGAAQCGDRCGVDLRTDLDNCGACAHACPPRAACQAGSCVCSAGQTVCSTGCTDVQTDLGNCGACGTTCAIGGTCVGGVCGCPAGQTACPLAGAASFALCVDEQVNPVACGSCGQVCPTSAPVCRAGACVVN